jgi:hypothetical protein
MKEDAMTDPETPPPSAADSPETDVPAVEENEVLRESRRVRALQDAAKKAEKAAKSGEGAAGEEKSGMGWKAAAAAGIGVGSAALIAALLYSNRNKD